MYMYVTAAIRPPPVELDASRLRSLAVQTTSSSSSSPDQLLKGKVAIVTGSSE
mgnify:CR=1 FL=1